MRRPSVRAPGSRSSGSGAGSAITSTRRRLLSGGVKPPGAAERRVLNWRDSPRSVPSQRSWVLSSRATNRPSPRDRPPWSSRRSGARGRSVHQFVEILRHQVGIQKATVARLLLGVPACAGPQRPRARCAGPPLPRVPAPRRSLSAPRSAAGCVMRRAPLQCAPPRTRVRPLGNAASRGFCRCPSLHFGLPGTRAITGQGRYHLQTQVCQRAAVSHPLELRVQHRKTSGVMFDQNQLMQSHVLSHFVPHFRQAGPDSLQEFLERDILVQRPLAGADQHRRNRRQTERRSPIATLAMRRRNAVGPNWPYRPCRQLPRRPQPEHRERGRRKFRRVGRRSCPAGRLARSTPTSPRRSPRLRLPVQRRGSDPPRQAVP